MLLKDLRYALRMLGKTPLFTAAVVLTMALGIGANTAIFSIVNAVLLRPLPFGTPERLVEVAERNDKLHLDTFAASVLNYLSWKEQTRTIEQLGAIGYGSFNLSGRDDPEQLAGNTITPSLLPLLGLKPVIGRTFEEGEDRPGSAPVAMIGEGLWRRRFGADPALVGGRLALNSTDYTIVGIVPREIAVLTTADVFVPLTIDLARERRLQHVITVVGRLKEGVSVRESQAEMDAIAGSVGQQFPEVKDWGIRLVPFDRWLVTDQLRSALLVLLAAIGCVLLIACANVANLLLARATARQKEIAVRSAMGASRVLLLRQLLVESLALSILGGAAGLLAAAWAVGLIQTLLPPNLLPVTDLGIDANVLLFALAMTLVTGLLFGIVPAWHAASADLNALLKQSARGSGGGARPLVRKALAATEISLATMLLIGAGLLTQTLMRLQRVDVGFRSEGLLTFQVALPATKYPGEKGPAFYPRLLESVGALPGVRSAAVSSGIPFGQGNYTRTPVSAPGATALPKDTPLPIDWRLVTSGFFKTMQIPLLRGEVFTDAGGPMAPATVVVSQGTARRFWGEEDPLGRILHRVADGRDFTVIGVAGEVRNLALNEESPTIYMSAATRVWPLMDVVLRTDGANEGLLPEIRQRVRELDPDLPIANVRTMEEWVRASAAQPRLNAVLLGVFAAVALLVAAIGIYGVMAYSVTQRTREIGLRMALGAQRGGVVRLIVREGMTVGLGGVLLGLLGALALSRVLASLVFGVQVRDPATFVSVALLLTLVALAACLLPARKACAVDPILALREE